MKARFRIFSRHILLLVDTSWWIYILRYRLMQNIMMSIALALVGCLLVSNIVADEGCVPLTAEYGIVCVCNSTYCDTDGSLPTLNAGEFAMITTSKSGQRFNVTTGKTIPTPIPHYMYADIQIGMKAFWDSHENLVYITVDPEDTYQNIEGFGGSFSDAAGINLYNISSAAQEYLVKSYFGTDGIDYTIARTPIGGSDFSEYAYAYNEYPVNDTYLANFTLSKEDFAYKIPFIQRAMELASEELRLHASVWSPPAWMKTNNKLYGHSELKPEFYYTYALYHLKFLQEYAKNNITVYAISTGNEPVVAALGTVLNYNSLGWVPQTQAEWLVDYLGPVIRNSELSDTKIYILDENIPFIDDFLTILAAYEGVKTYTDGVAVHWYMDHAYPMSVLNKVQEMFGNVSLLNTEACSGVRSTDLGLKLGEWTRAEYYMQFVIENLRNSVNGWIEWNMALNMKGGPKWNAPGKDAFIIVDAENDQFYKQPTYYAFGHVSKYVPRGSVRIGSSAEHDILNVAFQRPDGLIAVVVMNNATITRSTHIEDKYTGQYLNFTMPANSIATVVYNRTELLIDECV